MDDGIRILTCPTCGGEKRDLRSNGGPNDIDCGECPECEGAGAIQVAVKPIAIKDLESAHGPR